VFNQNAAFIVKRFPGISCDIRYAVDHESSLSAGASKHDVDLNVFAMGTDHRLRVARALSRVVAGVFHLAGDLTRTSVEASDTPQTQSGTESYIMGI
jgi:hypothetical protein